ncbi:MAG TPA: response regulator [Bdellovibrionales bacterium]|nr:response regulator [Bdellovibrionales bacterium]
MENKDAKILVVDDMNTMRRIIIKALGEMGFTKVAEAPDGQVAWEKIMADQKAGAPFDLIVSDWNMPNMKGIELLKRVRETSELKKTPFILVTAETEASQVKEAAQLGVSDYLTKPFAAGLLKEKVLRILAKSKGGNLAAAA